MALQSGKIYLGPIYWEKGKVAGFTGNAVNVGRVEVVFPAVYWFLDLVPSSGVFLQ